MTRTNAADQQPTEMEAAVLGVIWREGPCTAYSIRKNFLQSPSPRWSGSAGAIYPLLRRMEPLDLVNSTVSTNGKRNQRDYEITKKGLTVLRRWLRQLDQDTDIGLIHDPLRSKILFLDLLSKKQSMKLLKGAVDEIRSQLEELQKHCDESEDREKRTCYFADRNAILLTQARLTWLEEVLEEISE